MATKKDLLQAQTYSRRRLLTAFSSGIPDGVELEPRNPMRAVIAGITSSALLVVGSFIFGLIRPGLPQGWENNRLLISRDTGARFISQNGVLFPVINTTSARLLIPSDQFSVISVDDEKLSDIERGQTIGILGAPDALPTSNHLIRSNWTSCLVSGKTVTIVHTDTNATPLSSDRAIIASQGDNQYVITGAYRYLLPGPGENRAAVLRAIGLQNAQPVTVTADWLNLYFQGTDLLPITVPGAGQTVNTSSGTFTVGEVLTVGSEGSQQHFVVTVDGRLASLTDLGLQLYSIANSSALTAGREMTNAELSGLENVTTPIVAGDWPTGALHPADLTGSTACVTLSGEVDGVAQPALSRADDLADLQSADTTKGSVLLPPSGGALVRAVGQGAPDVGVVSVIDSSGQAYPVPNATEETIAQLGYQPSDVYPVPEAWLTLFPTGPSLTAESAGKPPTAASAEDSGASATSAGALQTARGTSAATVSATSVDAHIAADAQEQACRSGQVDLDPVVSPALVAMQSAYTSGLATGRGVTVAVVDSGVDFSNPHLTGVSAGGTNLVPDESAPDGGEDVSGHGTAVAGIIAAQPVAGSGVTGIAPDARVLSVRVFRTDDDQAKQAGLGPDVARIAEGIRYAVDQGAQIINVSLSDDTGSAELKQAVEYAESRGSLVVASAGNVSATEQAQVASEVRYPAAYEQVLGVAATDEQFHETADSVAGRHVDVAAPGKNIVTAASGGGDCTYATEQASSSFAAAYVSGAAALLAQRYPEEGPAGWRYRLELTASRANPDARTDQSGWGLIRPVEALTAVIAYGVRGPSHDGVALYHPERAEAQAVAVGSSADPDQNTKQAVLWIAIGTGTVMAVSLFVAGALRRGRSEFAPVGTGSPSPVRSRAAAAGRRARPQR